MSFASLASGASIFLDANILVYHLSAQPRFGPACTALVKRIEHNDLTGLTSTHILTEVAHRLMLIEASATSGRPLAGGTPTSATTPVRRAEAGSVSASDRGCAANRHSGADDPSGGCCLRGSHQSANGAAQQRCVDHRPDAGSRTHESGEPRQRF